ncbi:group II intron reverse transcriptase/maturase [Clostridium botulinum]|uniref:Reverse transcriptase domain-containing protein n=1 Tax=Clostridium botulinum B2 450 TaxID=1379739 RepID=A0A0D1BMX8_CLOBO|nr:group II intron reverse transcriptase/maturase [Clostridium botulinum]KEI83928.1 hypothetical protein N493_18585 [Clostridium botulinum B2 433]KIS21595.1 hypothetical protein N495_19510 [Clostridium botulinum B2 450]
MVQIPNNHIENEKELRNILDNLYFKAKENKEQGLKQKFNGLFELILSEVTILTAIHNIKSNKGSKTKGSNNETIDDILQSDYNKVIERIQKNIRNYRPKLVRRKEILKSNGKVRKLGIPTIEDRIIQECVRIIMEPIMEAQFYKHSYGFRPMRNPHMSLERVADIPFKTGYTWVIEGDIKGYFDTINHRILIKQLWNMGIKDKRVLMIIKNMLKAGIMNECDTNELGAPQGGIISPLLANVYLTAFDNWLVREWEEKKTQHQYTGRHKYEALKKTKLKPFYYVRYADDWVLITNSRENANKLKYKIKKWLESNLKIELSEGKTKITNMKKKAIKFLGFDIKTGKKSTFGYTTISSIDEKRLKLKMKDLQKDIRRLRVYINDNDTINKINKINSIIRGIVQYYEWATRVNVQLKKYDNSIVYTCYKALKKNKKNAKWVSANKVNNLISIHDKYTTQIPTTEYMDSQIGITRLCFSKFKKTSKKNQKETPYSIEGREIYQKRMKKKPLIERADELFNNKLSGIIAYHRQNTIYNFEYYLNRPYAFNRDKGKCKICGCDLVASNLNTHHINPYLPITEVNKVNNLASVCVECHKLIHSSKPIEIKKIEKKINKYRSYLKQNNKNMAG